MLTIEACVECVSVISSSVQLGDQPRVQKVLLLARKHGVTCVTRVTNLSRGYIFVSCCCVTLDPAHWLTAALTLAGPKIPHDRQGPHWPGQAVKVTLLVTWSARSSDTRSFARGAHSVLTAQDWFQVKLWMWDGQRWACEARCEASFI